MGPSTLTRASMGMEHSLNHVLAGGTYGKDVWLSVNRAFGHCQSHLYVEATHYLTAGDRSQTFFLPNDRRKFIWKDTYQGGRSQPAGTCPGSKSRVLGA